MTIRKALMIVLAVSLLAGFGCAKKQVAATPEEQGTKMATADDDAAAKRLAEQKAKEEAERKKKEAAAAEAAGEKVFFDFDKSEIKPEYRGVLQSKANILKEYPKFKVTIEGNCDERGTEEYNLALGERRARSAYEYLVTLGVEPSRLNVVSYGEDRPACQEKNEACYKQNRRDEFKVVK